MPNNDKPSEAPVQGDGETTWTPEAAQRQAEELERLRTGRNPSTSTDDPTMGEVVLDPNAQKDKVTELPPETPEQAEVRRRRAEGCGMWD